MTNLNGLIQEIRTKGVSKAEVEASNIIAEAETKAKNILKESRSEIEKKLAAAEERIQKLEEGAKSALKQAHRDLLLSVDSDLRKKFSSLLLAEVSSELSGDALAKQISSLLEVWAKKDSLEISVSEEDVKGVTSVLHKKFKEKAAKDGLVVKGVSSLQGGFKISLKESEVVYDFSAKEVSEVLSKYLNSNIVALIEA